MISANDILRMALETDHLPYVKLLWHLHSYTIDKASQQRFHRELQEWFPEALEELNAGGVDSNVLEHAFEYLQGLRCSTRTHMRVSGMLYAHMERSEKEARQKIYLTNIGRAVWETLDACLERRRPCFLEGLEGRGKSAAAKAWCEAHRGEARFASLTGFATQREFFSALSIPYGMPHLHTNAPTQIRYRIQDIVVRSGLVLVIDEAHFALPERTQNCRPAIIDWIDTALCNHEVPVALVSTPQFGPRLSEFENRTTYNANQFRRRFSRSWCRLDDKTSESDMIALVKKVLPDVGAKGIELAANYAGSFGRDVSALFDLVDDARHRARKAGRDSVTFQDLREAYKLDRVPNENALAAAFSSRKKPATKKEPAETPAAAPLQLACDRAATSPLLSTDNRRAQMESVNA